MSEVTINGLSEHDWKLAAAMASVQDHTIAALNVRLTAEKKAVETMCATAMTELEKRLDELDALRGAADAWGSVLDLCVRLGLKIMEDEPIVETVENFISRAVAPRAFCFTQPNPLLEAVEAIIAQGEEVDYSDWAVCRAKTALREYRAERNTKPLLQCIKQLATGHYQGAAYTGYATALATKALQHPRAKQ